MAPPAPHWWPAAWSWPLPTPNPGRGRCPLSLTASFNPARQLFANHATGRLGPLTNRKTFCRTFSLRDGLKEISGHEWVGSNGKRAPLSMDSRSLSANGCLSAVASLVAAGAGEGVGISRRERARGAFRQISARLHRPAVVGRLCA